MKFKILFSLLLLNLLVIIPGDKIFAATITVNSLLDNGPGDCSSQCTLRDAVVVANNNADASNTVDFSVTGTLVVSANNLITSTKNLTIQGPGASSLTIDFNNNNNNSITQSLGDLTISGLTLTKNAYNAIYVIAANKTFTLTDSVVTANTSKSAVNIKTGAAIIVNILNSTFSNNTGALNGGAIYNTSIGSNMTITNSSFSGNTVITNGGAVYSANAIVSINKSTFSGNTASLGGAVFGNSSAQLLTVTNSTFFNNTVTNSGSMIESTTPLNITNSTFVDNISTSGYGIYTNSASSVVNSIFYSNPANAGYHVCGGTLTSNGYNIDSGTSCGFAGTGDLNSTDPLLSSSWLTNNGGGVSTIALTASSPAINAGSGAGAPITDARGYGRVGVSDIGAYEYGAVLLDTTKPVITNFTIPSSSYLTVDITTFTATDNVGITGYLLTESSSTPSSGDIGWSGTAQTTYVFAAEGAKTLYAWAKDAANNISLSASSSVTVSLPPDVAKPVVTSFTIPSTSNSLTVNVLTFVATDDTAVTGYLITETSSDPLASDPLWTVGTSTSYVFTTEGSKTLYAWAKDAAGNISLSASGSVTITLPAVAVTTSSGPSTGSSVFTRYNNLVKMGNQTSAEELAKSYPFLLNTSTNTNTNIKISSSRFTFNKDLKYKDSNIDVKELQKYLNSNGFVVSTEGPGSVGNESMLFGVKTRAALIKYQISKGIKPAVGFLGPITRKAVNGN